MKYAFILVCAAIIAASIGGVLWFSPRAETIGIDASPARTLSPQWASDAVAEVPPEAPSPVAEAPVKAPSPAGRKWATPIERPGLKNFHRVSKDLYRGAQPTEEGMWELKAMGIKTVVNLRSFHSDRGMIGKTGLDYEHIPMKAWHAEDEDVVRFLRIATDKDLTPVFVHCRYGSDRTGMMVALYRIAVQGWSKEDALREMTEGPFGFHEIWQNLLKYMDKVGIEDIERKAGIAQSGVAR